MILVALKLGYMGFHVQGNIEQFFLISIHDADDNYAPLLLICCRRWCCKCKDLALCFGRHMLTRVPNIAIVSGNAADFGENDFRPESVKFVVI
jgi:hypothetical protein